MKTRLPEPSPVPLKTTNRNPVSLSANYAPRKDTVRLHSDLRAVRGILELALRKNGLDKKLKEFEFVSRWSEIVGESVARVSRPECVRRSALVVRVSSSAWAQELSFLKASMLEKLYKVLPAHSRVNDITFYVGEL